MFFGVVLIDLKITNLVAPPLVSRGNELNLVEISAAVIFALPRVGIVLWGIELWFLEQLFQSSIHQHEPKGSPVVIITRPRSASGFSVAAVIQTAAIPPREGPWVSLPTRTPSGAVLTGDQLSRSRLIDVPLVVSAEGGPRFKTASQKGMSPSLSNACVVRVFHSR